MIRSKAFSLVEVLIVLSIGSTVLAISVGTVHQAMQVAKTAQDHAQRSLHSSRFVEQFRNDVHLGVAVTLHANQSLTIGMDDRSEIVYAIEKSRVTREQKLSDGKTRRDTLTLVEGDYGTLDFDETSKVASLRILTNHERDQARPRLNRSIEAIPARAASSYTIEEARP